MQGAKIKVQQAAHYMHIHIVRAFYNSISRLRPDMTIKQYPALKHPNDWMTTYKDTPAEDGVGSFIKIVSLMSQDGTG